MLVSYVNVRNLCSYQGFGSGSDPREKLDLDPDPTINIKLLRIQIRHSKYTLNPDHKIHSELLSLNIKVDISEILLINCNFDTSMFLEGFESMDIQTFFQIRIRQKPPEPEPIPWLLLWGSMIIVIKRLEEVKKYF